MFSCVPSPSLLYSSIHYTVVLDILSANDFFFRHSVNLENSFKEICVENFELFMVMPHFISWFKYLPTLPQNIDLVFFLSKDSPFGNCIITVFYSKYGAYLLSLA